MVCIIFRKIYVQHLPTMSSQHLRRLEHDHRWGLPKKGKINLAEHSVIVRKNNSFENHQLQKKLVCLERERKENVNLIKREMVNVQNMERSLFFLKPVSVSNIVKSPDSCKK